MSQAELEFDTRSVVNACSNARRKLAPLKQKCDAIREAYLDAANTVVLSVDARATLRAELRRLVELTEEVKAYRSALHSLEQDYAPSAQQTGFDAVLQHKVDALLRSDRHRSDADEVAQEFEDAARERAGDAGVVELGEDEDLAVMGGADKNPTCPLTMLPLIELEDPVEDPQGFVYERSALMAHFGTRDVIECPVAGTGHSVCKQDIKPSKRVSRMKKYPGRRGATAAGQPGPSSGGGAGRSSIAIDV